MLSIDLNYWITLVSPWSTDVVYRSGLLVSTDLLLSTDLIYWIVPLSSTDLVYYWNCTTIVYRSTVVYRSNLLGCTTVIYRSGLLNCSTVVYRSGLLDCTTVVYRSVLLELYHCRLQIWYTSSIRQVANSIVSQDKTKLKSETIIHQTTMHIRHIIQYWIYIRQDCYCPLSCTMTSESVVSQV